jgi:hypothetical protein
VNVLYYAILAFRRRRLYAREHSALVVDSNSEISHAGTRAVRWHPAGLLDCNTDLYGQELPRCRPAATLSPFSAERYRCIILYSTSMGSDASNRFVGAWKAIEAGWWRSGKCASHQKFHPVHQRRANFYCFPGKTIHDSQCPAIST